MKEELLRGQPSKVAILNETAGLGPKVVLHEVRESALLETEGDALTFNTLLADASNNLRYILM